MLLAREERLEDQLVRILLLQGASKVEHIHTSLLKHSQGWSLAAVYKALRNLCLNGILVHSRGYYHVAQSWVFALSGLIDQYFESSLASSQGEHLLPPAGGDYSWRYSELTRLNSFASNLIIAAARQERVGRIYSWSPHLWFNLVQEQHERRYYEALRKLGVMVYKVVGGDSSLDRLTASLLPRTVVRTRLIPHKQFLPLNHYTITVGSFIITMKIARKTAEEIDTLFARAKGIETLDLKILLRIFRHDKCPSRLSIEHSVTKARNLQKRFTHEVAP